MGGAHNLTAERAARGQALLGVPLVVVTALLTANVKEQFAVFGGSGAIVFGVLTWLLLAVLLRGTAAKVEERQAAAAR